MATSAPHRAAPAPQQRPAATLALAAGALCWLLLAAWTAPAARAGQHPQRADALTTQERALHLLNRLAYGPGPGDIRRLRDQGETAWLEAQLAPSALPLPDDLSALLAAMPSLELRPDELFRSYGPPAQRALKGSQEAQKALRRKAAQVLQDSQRARLLCAVRSPRQLEAVLTEFWFDHFSVFSGKGPLNLLAGSYEREAIRPFVLGRFRHMLGAVAHHPAMLFYLDNWMNTAPGTKGARGRFSGLNENYARELLELHTLGVNGGYTQADVQALARILKGWGLERGDQARGFAFDPARHDPEPKTLLGRTFPASGSPAGPQEVEDALDMLARHPSTARHLAFKLARRFVADAPPPALVERLARVFAATDGDLRAVMRALVQSPEFWRREHYQARFKTPYRQVVSALRAAEVIPGEGRPALSALSQMGMPVYGWLTPDGYKDTTEAWLSPDAVLRRIDQASALAGAMRGRDRKGTPPAEQRLRETLGPGISPRTLGVLDEAPDPLRPALILGSPDFMRH